MPKQILQLLPLYLNILGITTERVFFAIVRSVLTTPVILYTRTRGCAARVRMTPVLASILVSVSFATFAVSQLAQSGVATAATSDTLNFQARLETISGGIADDGNYNVEFKLYNVTTGGTALWTETYRYNGPTDDDRVRVENGYLTVNLGSITDFPSMNWDQDLYITMNIGGTATTPTWDGEMNPRLKLTAVPYAFSAGNLSTAVNGFVSTLSFTTPTMNNSILLPDASGTVCLANSLACGFATNDGASGAYIRNSTMLQTTANFNIQSSSTGSVTAAIQALTGQTADLLRFNDAMGSPLSGINASGQLYYQSGSFTGTLAQQTLNNNVIYYLPQVNSGSATICLTTGNCAGTGGGITGAGVENYIARFNTAGSIDSSTLLYDNGMFIGLNTITNTGLLSVVSTNASQAGVYVEGATSATAPVAVFQQGLGQTGDLLQVRSSNGSSSFFSVADTGTTIGGPGTIAGVLNFANGSNGQLTSIIAQAPTGTGNVTYRLPTAAGGTTYTLCTTAGNCAGTGGGITGTGVENYIARFNTAGTINSSTLLYDDGVFIGLNTISNAGLLSIIGQTAAQSSAFIQGAPNATASTLVLKGGSGQTGKLLELTNAANGLAFRVAPDGATEVGGTLSVASTLGVTGLTTLSGGASVANGLTATGAINLNTTGTGNTAIGNTTGSFSLASNALNITAVGAVSGVTTLDASGLISANGGLTIASGQALTVNGDSFTDLTGSGLRVTGGALTVDDSTATGFFRNGGNSFGANAVLGTNDNFDLSLRTNGTSRLNVTASGDVAIGAISPNGRFTVQGASSGGIISSYYSADGTLRSYLGDNGLQAWIVNDGAAEVGTIGYTTPGGTPGIVFLNAAGTGRSQIRQLGTSGGLSFGSTTGNGVPANQVVITTAGNLGVGTTTPAYRLDVNNGTGIVGRFSGRVIGAAAVNNDEFVTLGQADTRYQMAGAYVPGTAADFIQNGTAQQTGANFNIDGTGTAAVFNATTALQTSGVVRIDATGNFSGTNADFTGTLNVGGAITAATTGDTINGLIISSGTLSGITGYSQGSGDFAITGNGTFSTGTGAISLNGATAVTGANTFTVGSGATSFGGTLSVAGLTTLSSGLTVAGTTDVTTLDASGLISANAGLTVATGQALTVNGDAVTDLTGSGLALVSGALTVDATSATGFFRNGGNSFGGPATLGTNDTNSLAFRTDGTNRITILANGNVGIGTGTPSALLSVGSASQFQVNGAGAITAVGVNSSTGLIEGTGGLTVGGTVTLSSLGAGLVQSDAAGVLSSGAVNRNSSVFFSDTLSVANGGTGATSFAANGLLYGSGTGALQATAAGTGGQILQANATGIPTFVSFTGDLSVATGGATTINSLQGNTLTITIPASGQYLRYNGTAFVNSAIQAADVPDLSASYIRNSTTQQTPGNFNISGSGVIGGTLNVSGTSTFNDSVVITSGNLALSNGGLSVIRTPTIFSPGVTTSSSIRAQSEGAADGSTNLRTLQITAQIDGGNNSAAATALNFSGINNSTATIGVLQGSSASVSLTSSGSVTNARGYVAIGGTSGSGNINNYRGFSARTPSLTSTGIITTSTAFFAEAQKVTGVTNGYGFYQAGANDFNYFAGNLGLGDTTPVAALTVGNGDLFQVDSTGAIAAATGITTTGNVSQTGTGTFSTGTGAVSLNGATTVSGANPFSVGTGATTLGGSLAVTGTSTFTGLVSANGGLTVATGQNFTVNGDTFTDLTGSGLRVTSGALNVDDSTATGFFRNGGNSFGTTANIGTNDTNNLNLQTSGTARISIGTGTAVSILNSNYLNAAGTILNVGVANDSAGQLVVRSETATRIGAAIRGAASQTADLLQFQNTGGTAALSGFNSGGQLFYQSGTFRSTLVQQNLAQNQTITLPASTSAADTICLLALNNCGNGTIGGTGMANYVARFSDTETLTTGLLYDTGSAVSVGGTSPSALFNVGATNQFQVSSTGAVTAVGVNSGAGLLQGTGSLNITGASGQDIAQFRNSGGTSVARLDSAGNLFAANGSLSGTLNVTGTSTLTGNTAIATAPTTNRLAINTAGTVDALAQVQINTGAAANRGLVIQGVSGQSGRYLETQNASGRPLFYIADSGGAAGVIGIRGDNGSSGYGTIAGNSNGDLIVTPGGAGAYGLSLGGANGNLRAGSASLSAGKVALAVQQATGATADAIQTLNGAGTVLFRVDNAANLFAGAGTFNGNVTINGVSTFTTGTGAITFSGRGAGLLTTNASGVVSSGAVNRNDATYFNTALSVANGGTGTTSLAANGILYGSGTGAIQTTAAAADSILATNGTNVPALTQTLPTAVQANITSTGALASGSITTGFGTISTGNNITTTAQIQGGTLRNTAGSFAVNASGNVIVALSGVGGGTLVCQNASNQLSTCTNTYAQTNDTTNFIRNQTTQQASANFNISGTGIASVLQAGSFDANTATALTIGDTNATSVTIARTGIATTVGGSLSVTQATTLSSTLNVSGATSLSSSLAVTGSSTFTGLVTANGGLTVANNGNITQTGTGTFSTGTGAVSLNGATAVTGTNTFSVGTGAASFGGTVDVSGASNFNSNLTVNGSTLAVNTGTVGRGVSIAAGAGGVTIAQSGSLAGASADTQAILLSQSGAQQTSAPTVRINGAQTAADAAALVINQTGSAQILQLRRNNTKIFDFGATGSLTLGNLSTGSFAGSLQFADGTNNGFGSTLNTATLSANRTISLPNESGTVCLQNSANCGFAAASPSGNYVQLAPATTQVDVSTNDSIAINKTGASGNLLQLQSNGASILRVNSSQVLVNNPGTGFADSLNAEIVARQNGISSGGIVAQSAGFGGRGAFAATNAGTEFFAVGGVNAYVDIQQFAGQSTADLLRISSAGGTSGDVLRVAPNGATILGGTLAVTGASTFTGLVSANGGLTVATGQTFTVNGDAFTDLTGSGLRVTSGALDVDDSTATGFFRNGGNSFGANAVLGTNDATTLSLRTNGANRLTVNSSGQVSINGPGGAQLSVGGQNTAPALTLAAGASQSANLFQLQDSAGNINAAFNALGNGLTLGRIATTGTVQGGTLTFADGTTSGFGTILSTVALTANRTINLPNENGTICLQNSTNCGFGVASPSGAYVQLAPATAQADNSANDMIYLNKTSATGSLIRLQRNGSTQFIVDNAGNVGIGTAAPEYSLEIRSGGTSGLAIVNTDTASGAGAGIQGLRGSLPTAANQRLGFYTLGALSGSTNYNSAAIEAYSEQAFNSGARGTTLSFATTAQNSSTRTTRLTIAGNGNVGIGTTAAPNSLLSVGGTTGNFLVNNAGAIAAVTGINNSGAYVQSGINTNTFTGSTTVNTDSTTALQVRNGATYALTADATNGKVAVGLSNVAAGGSLLQIGGNTTAADGGLQFGTDASATLFRSGSNTLQVGGALITGGALTINNGTLNVTSASANIVTANALSVNFATAATSLTMGATTGITTIRNDVTLSKYGQGILQTSAAGVVTSTTLSRNSALLIDTLSVANGGTGATTFASNGLLFGNGTGAIQATTAGTAGQILAAGTGGTPAFRTLGGDISISTDGTTTSTVNSLQGNTLTISAPAAGQYLRYNGSAFVNSAIQAADIPANTFIRRVPTATTDNTINPSANGVVALTVMGTTGTSARVLEIYNSAATPTLQAYFDATGSLNVSQVIQPTANNTIDLGTTANRFRTGYFGTNVNINGSTLSSTALGFVGAGAISSPGTLDITGVGNSSFTTSSGVLTLQAAGNTVNLGSSIALASTAANFTLLGTPTTINAFNAATAINLGASAGSTITAGGAITLNTASNSSVNAITIKPGTTTAAIGAVLSLSGGNTSGATGGNTVITGGNGTTTGGSAVIDAGTGTTNGTVNIGGSTASAVNLGRNGVTTNSLGNLSVASGQSFTIVNGTSTQTYSSTAGSADTLNVTNTAASGTTQVNGRVFNLNGTTTTGSNIINGVSFNTVTPTTGNTFNGISFGNGYNNFITSGTFSVAGSGNITSAGTYNTNTFTASSLQFGAGAAASVQSASGQALNINTVNGGNVTIGNATTATTQVTLQNGAGSSVVLASTGTTVTGTLRATGIVTVDTLGIVDTANYLCRNAAGQLTACLTTGNGVAFVQGGNNFGANAVFGTTGAGQTLSVVTAGVSRFTVDTAGNFTFNGNGNITSTGSTSVDAAAGNTVNVGATAAGTVNIGATGATNKVTAINIGTSTAAVQTLSVGSGFSTSSLTLTGGTGGIVATSTGNISLTASGTATASLDTNTGAINIGGGATVKAITLGNSTVAGTVTTQTLNTRTTLNSIGMSVLSSTNSNMAFAVQNVNGANALTVDTSTPLNLAVNSGAENAATFAANWTSHNGSTIARTTTAGEFISGTAGTRVTTTAANQGVKNNIGTPFTTGTRYIVTFTARTTSSTPNDLAVSYLYDGTTTDPAVCLTYPLTFSSNWLKYSCSITPTVTGNSSAALAIFKTTTVGAPFFVDNLNIIAQQPNGTAQNTSFLRVGGLNGQGLTLFQADTAAARPVLDGGAVNPALFGAMYYDTALGKMQCYEANGWGYCGASPDVSVNLIPEYAGAVLNGTGIGTLTSNLCSFALNINVTNNDMTCTTTGEDYSYYTWTSPQATGQTYSIYVRYQLPATFRNFDGANTIKLTARTTSLATGGSSTIPNGVRYTMYNPDGTLCGTTTTVNTAVNTWQTTPLGGDETLCTGLTANSIVTFKIDVTASSGSKAYVSNLSFLTKGQ